LLLRLVGQLALLDSGRSLRRWVRRRLRVTGRLRLRPARPTRPAIELSLLRLGLRRRGRGRLHGLRLGGLCRGRLRVLLRRLRTGRGRWLNLPLLGWRLRGRRRLNVPRLWRLRGRWFWRFDVTLLLRRRRGRRFWRLWVCLRFRRLRLLRMWRSLRFCRRLFVIRLLLVLRDDHRAVRQRDRLRECKSRYESNRSHEQSALHRNLPQFEMNKSRIANVRVRALTRDPVRMFDESLADSTAIR
jgi:hypothetical protein